MCFMDTPLRMTNEGKPIYPERIEETRPKMKYKPKSEFLSEAFAIGILVGIILGIVIGIILCIMFS